MGDVNPHSEKDTTVEALLHEIYDAAENGMPVKDARELAQMLRAATEIEEGETGSNIPVAHEVTIMIRKTLRDLMSQVRGSD